jgi:hypothetical protein
MYSKQQVTFKEDSQLVFYKIINKWIFFFSNFLTGLVSCQKSRVDKYNYGIDVKE